MLWKIAWKCTLSPPSYLQVTAILEEYRGKSRFLCTLPWCEYVCFVFLKAVGNWAVLNHSFLYDSLCIMEESIVGIFAGILPFNIAWEHQRGCLIKHFHLQPFVQWKHWLAWELLRTLSHIPALLYLCATSSFFVIVWWIDGLDCFVSCESSALYSLSNLLLSSVEQTCLKVTVVWAAHLYSIHFFIEYNRESYAEFHYLMLIHILSVCLAVPVAP